MSKIELLHGRFEEIDDLQCDLLFADPPDNTGMKYDGYVDRISARKYRMLLVTWVRKACQITNGAVFFSIAEKWIPIIEYLVDTGEVRLIQRLYWYYTFGQNNKTRYSPCVRHIYWLNKDVIYPDAIKVPSARQVKYGDKRAKEGGKMPSNVWEFSRVCGTFKEKRRWHVTQHPEALMERVILGHSLPGQIVLDPFIGSGTTALVGHQLNRNVVGIDCSQFYIDKIKEEFQKRYGV